jgi:hypothetical protein
VVISGDFVPLGFQIGNSGASAVRADRRKLSSPVE